MSKWFRQLAEAPAEYWKSLIFGEEGYRFDQHVQMGRTIAAHHGHRLALLISEIIDEMAYTEDWLIVRTPNRAMLDEQRHAL